MAEGSKSKKEAERMISILMVFRDARTLLLVAAHGYIIFKQ